MKTNCLNWQNALYFFLNTCLRHKYDKWQFYNSRNITFKIDKTVQHCNYEFALNWALMFLFGHLNKMSLSDSRKLKSLSNHICLTFREFIRVLESYWQDLLLDKYFPHFSVWYILMQYWSTNIIIIHEFFGMVWFF